MCSMENTLYMAPMLSFTDCDFREVFFRHFGGIDRAIAPFIVVSENSRYRKKAVQSLLPSLHEKVPIEPQILGRDPAAFAALVNLLEEEGFTSININMGCPADAVVNKGRGSGFLPHPDRVDAFLDSVLSKIRIPLSLKLRTGLYSHDEIYALVPLFNRYPLSEIIIHPRLGVNKYEGPVDLEVMEDLMAIVRKPIVFSGDVGRSTFYRYNRRFRNISRWMLGRELIRDPFLPQDIKESLGHSLDVLKITPPLDEGRLVLFRAFHDDLLEVFSGKLHREEAVTGKMKSYWYYWESLFPGRDREIGEMKKNLRLDEYRVWVDRIMSCH